MTKFFGCQTLKNIMHMCIEFGQIETDFLQYKTIKSTFKGFELTIKTPLWWFRDKAITIMISVMLNL